MRVFAARECRVQAGEEGARDVSKGVGSRLFFSVPDGALEGVVAGAGCAVMRTVVASKCWWLCACSGPPELGRFDVDVDVCYV